MVVTLKILHDLNVFYEFSNDDTTNSFFDVTFMLQIVHCIDGEIAENLPKYHDHIYDFSKAEARRYI